MRKLILLAVAVFFVVGLVTSAYAEDRLSLSGSYRARAWGKNNYGNFLDSDKNDDQFYWDQRFRLGGKIQVAEGISAHFRMDLAEVQWGQQTTSNLGWNRGSSSSVDNDRQFQLDRAYARWERDYFILTFGQAFTSFGNQIVVDQNQFGAILRLKLPVVVDLVYSKISEGGSLSDSGNFGDQDFVGGQANYQGDNWNFGILGAGVFDSRQQTDTTAANFGEDLNEEPAVFGAFGSVTWGPFSAWAEFDTFFGTAGRTDDGRDIDAKGNQIVGDFRWNAMPNLYVGVNAWWSDSQKGDTKRKITGVTDSDSWQPDDWATGFHGAFVPMGNLGTAVGGGNTAIEIFDPDGSGGGGIGAGIYANWRFMEKFQLRGSFLWAGVESTDALDSVPIFNVGLIWDCLPNTTARVGYNYTSPDTNADQLQAARTAAGLSDVRDLDNAQGIVGMIQLTW